jgi:hypothetical protein
MRISMGGALEFGSTSVPDDMCRSTFSLSVSVGPPICIFVCAGAYAAMEQARHAANFQALIAISNPEAVISFDQEPILHALAQATPGNSVAPIGTYPG